MTPPARDRDALRWSTSLIAALLLHAVPIGVAWWWQRVSEPTEPPPLPAQAVMVELAPAPRAPPAPPTALPPAPPQAQRDRPAPPPPPTPPAEPKPPRTPPTLAPAPQPQPPSEPTDRAAAQAAAPPDIQAPTDRRYAAAQPLAGARAQAMVTWQARLLGHLERFKRYPRPAQRRRQQGVTQVRFAVDRQGRVSAIGIAGSSGHPVLDAETLATVNRAAPLPPPPEIEGERVEVVVPVAFHLMR